MKSLSIQILEETNGLSEGVPISAKALLHLGNRAAVDQALSRLARRGKLLRARRGTYLRPVESRFGERAPAVKKVVEEAQARSGEIIVSSGAAAANQLGLTTQVPVRQVYLTSGPSREFRLGKQVVEFRHAPRWQLTLAYRPAGTVVRALAWVGPNAAKQALRSVSQKLTSEEIRELKSAAGSLPTWLAKPVSELVLHA
ncbi:DUF6088 family protein [Bradyrhizobium sp. WYCCWR 13023]|uniref:DUF6088 family protein n=1 Tax=Bradyrhizobium zhengyangense TaxID=2911009 RepID=A0A9X1UDJ6_9BRAD|nr:MULTISPECIES: DUF6088 family protein [Bradyrhizobium]MCG2631484.1 DUF6088 family protein [Bradyrhizobium zhengyangense]MCG2643743.1 DUF6088 family protein [Bradyrhizobium zhengyangense]MCG2671344.1 DUF6088 family protein [Bradyrhizobium zhengyangense]MDA9522883.1 hypothetical protein [Bradyrhizobium sp. CCBAU 11434]